MTKIRIKHLYEDHKKALRKLSEALKEDIGKSEVIIDGVVQRFEFTFELSWKLLKSYLEYEGFGCNSPRACIKQAYQSKIIKKGKEWIAMLEDRNLTSHIYDEKRIKEIYERIKKIYIKLFIDLDKTIISKLKRKR